MVRKLQKSNILDVIISAENVSSVLDAMYRSCIEIGGEMFSYHPEVMFEGIASARSEVFSEGFPPEWVKLYNSGGGKIIDPVPDLIMRKGRVMTWREALTNMKLNDRERAHIAQAQKYGLVSGFGFPLWGPKGHNAFVAIGSAGPEFALHPDVLYAEHMLLMAGHHKIQELISSALNAPALSDREREVLTWVGKGKSNTDIAAILEISSETVATYVRRIFGKLDCNDRMGAVIKALKLGLIRV